MKFIGLPPIRVHCWGGLGSQLFALSLILELRIKFPKRKIVLFGHTGGVSQRYMSVNNLISDLDIRIVNDFISSTNGECEGQNHSQKINHLFRKWTKKFLCFSGLVEEMNETRDMDSAKRWLLSTRGHYSYRVITQETLTRIWPNLGFQGLPSDSLPVPGIGIHYRLGDLLELSSKESISEARIIEIARLIISENKEVECFLFSDSIDLAANRLSDLNNVILMRKSVTSPMDTIQKLVSYSSFVGTNSKISMWVTILRCHLFSDPAVSLPLELKPNMIKILEQRFESKIKYY